MIQWRTDVENIPRDRYVLIVGIPTEHENLQSSTSQAIPFVCHWDSIDQAFCINGGDWMGPFIMNPVKWAEIAGWDAE